MSNPNNLSHDGNGVVNLFIEPSDVWLFRDGKPFTANEDHRAISLFPPTPYTLQGVIRSAKLAQSGASFTDQSTWSRCPEVGAPGNYGNLRMRGPVLATRDNGCLTRFFPQPQDLVKHGEAWERLQVGKSDSFQANWPMPGLRPLLDDAPQKFESGWMTDVDLIAYLSGKQLSPKPVKLPKELFHREGRFGVEIEGVGKRPKEGHLYQVEFIRPNPGAGLLLEVKGVPLDPSGLLAVGGEARAGRYETRDVGVDLTKDERLDAVAQSGGLCRFTLYLATQAFFSGGWVPQAVAGGSWRGVPVTLIAAVIGKPQNLGGFNLAGDQRQKVMRRAVPAGSVYFFETQASADEVFAAFDGHCVSDVDSEIGFGLSYVGSWKDL